jgi:NDP-sugar pyrophosphorylase family protein
MKAMLFAAGLGTRLGELTKDKPKALVEIKGKTLLEYSIDYLKSFGVTTIVINVHHFAQKIIDFVKDNNNFGIEIIISDETNLLLDTGGGLLKAKEYFDEDFIVYNTDIITDLQLDKLIDFHKNNDGIVSLAVRNRETQRYIIFDDNFLLSGWTNLATEEKIITRKFEQENLRAFSGIHILSPRIFPLLENFGQEKFSITKAYIEFSKTQKLYGFEHNYGYWIDTGKLQDLQKAYDLISGKNN